MRPDYCKQLPQPFPWGRVMQFGFCVLKLSSAQFWAMTPREISYAMRAYAPMNQAPLSRSEFNALLTQFPDRGSRK